MGSFYNEIISLFMPINPPTGGSGSYIPSLYNVTISILLYVGGLAALAAIFYGGFVYITAMGDDAKAAKGRKSIIAGVVGELIVIFSLMFMRVLSQLFS